MKHHKIFDLLAPLMALVLSGETVHGQQVNDNQDKLKQAVEQALPEAAAFAQKLRVAIKAANAQAAHLVEQSNARLRDYEKALKSSVTGEGTGFDLDRLLNQNVPAFGEARDAGFNIIPPLLVMASLSMPDESLKALIHDVGAVGGRVILRGFYEGSLKATAARLQSLVEKDSDKSGVGIDPRLFQTFNVTAVPTFVIPGGPIGECNTPGCIPAAPPHDRISGNITLRYALETLRSDGVQAKLRSAQYLKRLGGFQ